MKKTTTQSSQFVGLMHSFYEYLAIKGIRKQW